MSWAENTAQIVNKCFSKLWILKRLSKLGAEISDLIDIYVKRIRVLAEYAVPVWNGGITQNDVSNLERIQKCALQVILGTGYTSYNNALRKTGLPRLKHRRRKICQTFAKKARSNPKFSNWFVKNPAKSSRVKKLSYCPVVFRTERFRNSPISYLMKLLNE